MKRLLLLLIMTIILFSNIVTLKAQPLDINAQAYILIDSKTGQVLAEHNPDLRTYPASTLK